MIVSIFSISINLSYLGSFLGVRRGENVSKTNYSARNECQMLKFSTSNDIYF